MPRYEYGGQITHLIVDTNSATGDLRLDPGGTVQFYTTLTGGSVSTDYLVDSPLTSGTLDDAATSIRVEDNGYLERFLAANNVAVLYYDLGDGSPRRALLPNDGPAGSQPDASETVKGIVELADSTEAIDPTVTDRAMTPAGVATAVANAGPAILAGHLSALDPHTQYMTAGRGDARYWQLGAAPTPLQLGGVTGTAVDGSLLVKSGAGWVAGPIDAQDADSIINLAPVARGAGDYNLLTNKPTNTVEVLRTGGSYPSTTGTQRRHFEGTVPPASGSSYARIGDKWTKSPIDF